MCYPLKKVGDTLLHDVEMKTKNQFIEKNNYVKFTLRLLNYVCHCLHTGYIIYSPSARLVLDTPVDRMFFWHKQKDKYI